MQYYISFHSFKILMWLWFYDPTSTHNTGTGKIVKEQKMQTKQRVLPKLRKNMLPQIYWNTEIKTETTGLTQSFSFHAPFSDKKDQKSDLEG